MTDPVDVPGYPSDRARVLTALEVVTLLEGGGTDGVRGSMKFAHLCGVDEDGVQIWQTLADVEQAEWPRVKAVALAGFAANGLIKAESGN